ncbi:insulinase family protein, partial [Duncaniella muris]|uniref:insulinase family protein n=1 Tax=Duncaniella muris TaxID=2094150 RepID=UPI00267576D5
MAPKIFSEPQYQLTPIGTMDVVMNFPYNALRDYYHKWYRPDQQGIIVVGDFNADDMEKKVVEMFSDIPMPENAAPR